MQKFLGQFLGAFFGILILLVLGLGIVGGPIFGILWVLVHVLDGQLLRGIVGGLSGLAVASLCGAGIWAIGRLK